MRPLKLAPVYLLALLSFSSLVWAESISVKQEVKILRAVRNAARKPKDKKLAKELSKLLKDIDSPDVEAYLAAASALGFRLNGDRKMFDKGRDWLLRKHPHSDALEMLNEDDFQTNCQTCNSKGETTAKCNRCRGTGRCSWPNCDKGKLPKSSRRCRHRHYWYDSNGRRRYSYCSHCRSRTYSQCNHCSGTGKCTKCNGNTKLTNKCSKCGGDGKRYNSKSVKDAYISALGKVERELKKEVARTKSNRSISTRRTKTATLVKSRQNLPATRKPPVSPTSQSTYTAGSTNQKSANKLQTKTSSKRSTLESTSRQDQDVVEEDIIDENELKRLEQEEKVATAKANVIKAEQNWMIIIGVLGVAIVVVLLITAGGIIAFLTWQRQRSTHTSE